METPRFLRFRLAVLVAASLIGLAACGGGKISGLNGAIGKGT